MAHDSATTATRSPVIFKYIEDSYPTDGEINFTIVSDRKLQPDDYISLHTIGSYDENCPIFKLTYDELRIHSDGHVASAIIPVSSFASCLPDDGFYQLCYYSDSKLIDASTPIQIRRARAEDLLEVSTCETPGEDEFVVIKSDKALLQERINLLTKANEDLESERYALTNYLRKIEKDLDEVSSMKARQDNVISQLREENNILNQSVSACRIELQDREKQLETATVSLEQYRAISREKVNEFNEISKCKNLVQQEHQKSLQQLEAMKKQTENLMSTLQQTRANFDSQSALIQDGQAVQEAMKREIQDLTRRNDDAHDKLRFSQAALEKAQIASKLTELKYEDSQKMIDRLTLNNKTLQGDLVKVTEELSKTEQRHDKLKARVSAYFERKKAKATTTSAGASSDNHTIPKTVDVNASAATDDQSITLPCGVCGDDIACTSDLREMALHMELGHNIRLCPFCSMTFDASLSTTDEEIAKHVEEHLEALADN